MLERRLTQVKAAQLLGLGPRQVGRLCAAYERHGPPGLVSRQRGKASNRRLPEALQARETLRKWMAGAGIWLTRDKRRAKAHQPRHRRACLGELVQIDGSPHAWFEDRGPPCSLLVYVDDATSALMELRFVEVESDQSCW